MGSVSHSKGVGIPAWLCRGGEKQGLWEGVVCVCVHVTAHNWIAQWSVPFTQSVVPCYLIVIQVWHLKVWLRGTCKQRYEEYPSLSTILIQLFSSPTMGIHIVSPTRLTLEHKQHRPPHFQILTRFLQEHCSCCTEDLQQISGLVIILRLHVTLLTRQKVSQRATWVAPLPCSDS